MEIKTIRATKPEFFAGKTGNFHELFAWKCKWRGWQIGPHPFAKWHGVKWWIGLNIIPIKMTCQSLVRDENGNRMTVPYVRWIGLRFSGRVAWPRSQ